MKKVILPEDFDLKKFVQKAESIYKRKYQRELEKTEKGKIVAIEVESEEGFVETSVLKAAMKARKKYPDKLFHFIRIGYPAVHSIKGVVHKD
ncbi:MAG: hypothetical protein ACE5J9_02305 [Methanosarcinales archaeon]